jgi:hypothetical protein
MTQEEADPKERVRAFRDHLRAVAKAFNDASTRCGLGVLISSKAAEAALESTGYDAALKYSGDGSGEGELHAEQIATAVEATAKILGDKRQAGLIQGAMQSGKTTTSLALQFAAPAYYIVTGQPLYPVYLLTVHTSQAEQTRNEFERFLLFYRHLHFVPDSVPARILPLVDASILNADFRFAPSLHIYREYVLRSAFSDLFSASASPEEFVARRTRGKAIGLIADRIQAIVREHFKPVMIIDEPQFGVMDRIVPDPRTGELTTKPTVFKQIFREIEERLAIEPNEHCLVALSATPYEMYDVDAIWTVHQQLGKGYCGYNFIAGAAIDETQQIVPPNVLSLAEFAQSVGIPDLSRVNVAAIDRPSRFEKLRGKLGIPDEVDHEKYRQQCVFALRGALLALVEREDSPDFGICVRAKNQNEFARELARQLELDGVYEVLQYNGSEASGRSVKRIVASRTRKDIPYLLLVTNRARMGDAFPRSARYFIELAERFSDMNAMFQGFLGRACGYNKSTTVIVSETNAALIRDIVYVNGRYIYKPSQGSIIVGMSRRGRPTTLFVLRRDDADPVLAEFFKRIDRFVSQRLIATRDSKLRSRRSIGGDETTQYAPLLTDAAELGVFERIEDPSSGIAHELPGVSLLRPGQTVESTGAVTDDMTFLLNSAGGCRVTLRENVGSFATGGVRARGKLGGGSEREGQQMHLEPQILLRKHDPGTGEIISDRKAAERKIGDWRPFAVVLPLKRPVRPLIPGEGTLPLDRTIFDAWLDDDQRRQRDAAVHA